MQQYDVEAALEALGIGVDIRGHEASGLCPMHVERTGKEDHSPSWWINLQSGMHTCFSCHYKGNLIQLVCDVNKFYLDSWGTERLYDYAAAQSWLANIAEIPIEILLERLKALPTYLAPLPKPIEMSMARLAVFVEPPKEALESRGLTAEAVNHYGILWDKNTSTWILPLMEPHFNKLLGWQEKGTVDRTFKNRPAGLQKSKTLFGVNVQKEEAAIVVESPLDCARLHSAGFPGAVAVCGSAISEDQLRLLRYSEKIICAFDNPKLDAAGLKACKEMQGHARKLGLNLFYFNYGDSGKKDPGDMTEEEIRWGIDHAKSYVHGESAYV
jgi:hypothetical protein